VAIKNYFSSTGSWAKQVAVIAVFGAMGALLGSCGGSGVESTTPSVPTVPPVIALGVLPGAADVFADLPTDFSISGGTGPYTAGSSNTVLVPAPAVTGSAAAGFKITVIAKSANVDTPVTITIRDSLGATAALALNVKTTTLNNTVSITALSPTGTGCGTGICSGGDARVVVTAVLNGIRLRNRPIRFDVFQGDFRFVTPGSNALVTSILVNTDEQGEAVVRMTMLVTAPTQVATLTSTDTVSGLVRRTNFNIVQQTSGAGILSVLPSGTTTFTALKPAAGQPAQCPFGGVVDMYIYGGTPPYTVVSPLPQFLSVTPSVVTTNGGSFRVTQSGCGSSSLIVTDLLNRVVESSLVVGAASPAGDAAPAPVAPSITVTPTTLTVGCGQTGTASVSGSGTFTATVSTAGVPPGAFTVTPTTGPIPGTISFTRNTSVPPAAPLTSPTQIVVNVSGATTVPVTVNVPASCP